MLFKQTQWWRDKFVWEKNSKITNKITKTTRIAKKEGSNLYNAL